MKVENQSYSLKNNIKNNVLNNIYKLKCEI